MARIAQKLSLVFSVFLVWLPSGTKLSPPDSGRDWERKRERLRECVCVLTVVQIRSLRSLHEPYSIAVIYSLLKKQIKVSVKLLDCIFLHWRQTNDCHEIISSPNRWKTQKDKGFLSNPKGIATLFFHYWVRSVRLAKLVFLLSM